MTKRKNYTQDAASPEQISCHVIGWVRSPYTERHGTPRQAILDSQPENYIPVEAYIELNTDVVPVISLKDIEGFSRIWVLSFLHLNHHWNPTVRPPRGARIRRGTLATRAPHRPNPIGLSALRLIRVEENRIYVEGIDLLDGTPILDIKPYVPYCDSFPDAKAGYVDELQANKEKEKEIWGKKEVSRTGEESEEK
jgi:tRNA-Thr(GGU) m(6)t(6)A37 methyltransferase TsaA